jgi:hypothetical protein
VRETPAEPRSTVEGLSSAEAPRWALTWLLSNRVPRPLKKVRDLALSGIHSSTISATQSAYSESALANSVAVSAATPTALTPKPC